VDLSKSTTIEQQEWNYKMCAEMTKLIRKLQPKGIDVSVGGEIGEVGGKNSTPEELRAFTRVGRFGYFRHILRAKDVPVGELLAAHVDQANAAHLAAGDPAWAEEATKELIVLLRDDYPTLMAVLSALGDAVELVIGDW